MMGEKRRVPKGGNAFIMYEYNIQQWETRGERIFSPYTQDGGGVRNLIFLSLFYFLGLLYDDRPGVPLPSRVHFYTR
jgi:hypothetical protein